MRDHRKWCASCTGREKEQCVQYGKPIKVAVQYCQAVDCLEKEKKYGRKGYDAQEVQEAASLS